jgi:hypothetical protein
VVGVLDREREWRRPRAFARWDALGGPTRWQRWWLRRPWAGAAIAAALVVGLWAWTGRLFGLGIVAIPACWWLLRTDAALLEEWRERGPSRSAVERDPADPPRGFLERMDRRNQHRSEVDNAAYVESDGDWDAQVSPLVNRYWQLHAGWIALVAVGALVWFGVTALLGR